MFISFRDLNRESCYKYLSSVLIPRPIAWVSTISEQGIFNLAPFSFFGGLSTKPPVIYVSVGRRKGEKKDTLRNIESTNDFVVNMVNVELSGKMNESATDYPYNESEFEKTGLTSLPSIEVKSPRVAESPVNLECKLLRIDEYGDDININSVIIGEVLIAHVKDELACDGVIDMKRLDVLGRLGGDLYCKCQDTFEIKRIKI